MRQLRRVTVDSDLSRAPLVLRVDQPIAARPDVVWSVLTDDPSTWGDWCFGFDHSGRWTRQDPDGTGQERIVRVLGVRFHAEIHVSEPGRRWAFRIAGSSIPFARGMVEDWSFEETPDGCVLHWTGGVWPFAPGWFSGRLMAGAVRFLARRFGQGLAVEAARRQQIAMTGADRDWN